MLACESSQIDKQHVADESAIERVASSGPVTLTLRADRTDMAFTEPVRLVVDVLADRGVTIRLDDYASVLAASAIGGIECRVIASGETAAQPAGGDKLRWTRTFDLEFFLPGQYEVPAAKVFFLDPQASHGDSADSAQRASTGASTTDARSEQELTTDPITIHARESVSADLSPEELAQLDMPPPVELPPDPGKWWHAWWVWATAIAALGLLLAVVGRSWLRRRRAAAKRPIFVAPADHARAELERLLAERLLDHGRIREFYFRLTGVAREYVERGFDVAVPEQTTQEFLANLHADVILGPEDKGALGRFLQACDLIKYARHEPARDEHQVAIDAVYEFVDRTADRTRFLAARAEVIAADPTDREAAA